MQASPGAQAHFSYSTTLKRHGVGPSTPRSSTLPTFDGIRAAVTDQGPSSIWDKLISLAKGATNRGKPEENGYIPVPRGDQTPAAKYSCYDVEVRFLAIPNS
jgi:P-type Ca2+ transporter type 2C